MLLLFILCGSSRYSRIEIRDKPPSKYVIRCNFLEISASGSTELATACQHSKYFSFIFNYFSEYFSESGVWRGVDDCHPEHRGTIYRSSIQSGGVWSVYGDLSDFGNSKETIEMIRIFTNHPFNFTSLQLLCLLLIWIQMIKWSVAATKQYYPLLSL